MQNKPNFLKTKTNATLFAAKVYEEKPPLGDSKKQTQSNPIPVAHPCIPRPLKAGRTNPEHSEFPPTRPLVTMP
jgi:hypothetical protein